MINDLPAKAKRLVQFICFGLLLSACSKPNYYVFKTQKHKEKAHVQQDSIITSMISSPPITQFQFKAGNDQEKAVDVNFSIKPLKSLPGDFDEQNKPLYVSLDPLPTYVEQKKELSKLPASNHLEKRMFEDGEKKESRREGDGFSAKKKFFLSVLTLFFGFLGVHRYSLNYVTTGTVILILSLFSFIANPILWPLVIGWVIHDLVQINRGKLGNNPNPLE